MTAPAPTQKPPTAAPASAAKPLGGPPIVHRPNGFGAPPAGGGPSGSFAPAPPSPSALRTTALQSAVAVLRGKSPGAKTEDVVAMAEEFYQFLKKDAGQKLGPTPG